MRTLPKTKKAAYTRYLEGCNYLGLSPEFEYDDRTFKAILAETEALRARARKQKVAETKTSIAKNTANAVEFVEQGVGEPLAHFRDRASALAKKLGKAVPIKIVRNN